jgi:hypothetical protein
VSWLRIPEIGAGKCGGRILLKEQAEKTLPQGITAAARVRAGLLRLRRSIAAAIAAVSTIAATAATFAGPLVEFFAAATARPLVLPLRPTAAGLLHATGAAAVLALMNRAGLWFGCAGTVARGKRDFKLIELIPLFVSTVAVRDRQQLLQARPR